ncbi:unnamed protein product [Rotaria sp. Silwood1]|nr:unnamed protein product [Rotaria sp. Silwood1]CAF0861091.1 unnamed protein product [Rotaria sp. Silwood1]CAF3387359.1 unnamed protein product [Rotaria sp. Silwood1]CAF3387487.1 unnamed protein product [Rotaria sp. Silwood1]CAF4616242.1 unnamed protein product [Rotaria sp. Silwood1]
MAYRQHPFVLYKPHKLYSNSANFWTRNDFSQGIRAATIRSHHAPPAAAYNPVGTVSRIRTNRHLPPARRTITPPLILTTPVQPAVASHAYAPRHQPPIGARPMGPHRHRRRQNLPGMPEVPAHRGHHHHHRVPVRHY